MFAFLAALIFFLAVINVAIGTVNMIALGLFLLALHFAIGTVWAPYTTIGRRGA